MDASVYNRAGDSQLLGDVRILIRDSRRRRHTDPEGVPELPDIRDNRRGRFDHVLHRLPVPVGAGVRDILLAFSSIPEI